MSGQYRTIVADPPWPIPSAQRKAGTGGRRRNPTTLPYAVMAMEEIEALPVATLAEADAHLYLWITATLNREGIGARVARAWGFRVLGEIIWEKPNFGLGSFPRPTHEVLIVARRGRLPHHHNNVRSVQKWRIGHGGRKGNLGKWHSAKPDGAYGLIEANSPGPYLEMFARRHRSGWDVWGNEVVSSIELAAD